MPPLTLNLLGPLHVTFDDEPVAFRSDKERALLAFLAGESDRPHRREALTGLLYPDQPQTQAQANLRKTLFRLREALGQDREDTHLLLITPKTVQFNPGGPYTLDIQDFNSRLEQVRRHTHRRAETCAVCAGHCAAASALYRGEFLSGFNRSGSEAFEEWAVVTRERLHQNALDALEQLAAFQLYRRMWQASIQTARRLVELEPWRETGHRALMTAFAAQDQRPSAFAQYETCKRILAEQFHAEPEQSTRALYESIRDGTFSIVPPAISRLQSPLTPLIGREHELEILTGHLLDSTRRMHTVVGSGGIGKTRLVLAAAESVHYDFQDGAFFVPLSGINAAAPHLNDVIATAAADALGVTFSGTIPPARQLQNFLRDKQALLVLDNFEHLLGGARQAPRRARTRARKEESSAAWVVELVSTAPHVTVLLTSREPLNVRAESVFRLTGLAVPEPDREGNLLASAGVQLFVERATRAAGEFKVTPENLERVGRICRRVAGTPLAIELAASWTRTRTLAEIEAALEESFDFLATSQHDVPARHASLRAVWEGSWALLKPQEQALLARTCLFRGGFDYQAAKSIINAQQAVLDALMNKSLLWRSDSGRYELHELLRQFAFENLREKNELLYHNYCNYFINFIAQNSARLENSDPKMPLGEIRRELDNLRSAWQKTIEYTFLDILTPGAVQQITTFYYLTGLFREGLTMVEQALEHLAVKHAAAQSDPRAVSPPAASVHLLDSQLRLARARFLERLARYDEATAAIHTLLVDESLDASICARTHLCAGWVCYWTGKLEQGRAEVQDCLSFARAHAQTPLQADALYVAGLIEQSAANTQQAREYYALALALYRADRNRYGESSALVNLADIGVDNTRLDDALDHGKAALALATQIGKRFDQAAANVILGSLWYELGDVRRAAPYYTDALHLFREMGNGTGESIALRDLAMLALQRGTAAEALTFAQESARAANGVGSLYREGMAQTVIGDAYLALRDIPRAETAYALALELLRRAERGHRALDARAGLVRTAHARGDVEIAHRRIEELFAEFEVQNFYDSSDPSYVYLVCWETLVTIDPVRARDILERGIAELNGRAAQIQDNAIRREFLESNPIHRALRAAAQNI